MIRPKKTAKGMGRVLPSRGIGVGARSHNVGVGRLEVVDQVLVRLLLIFPNLERRMD